MDEGKRRQYLSVMGVTLWQSRCGMPLSEPDEQPPVNQPENLSMAGQAGAVAEPLSVSPAMPPVADSPVASDSPASWQSLQAEVQQCQLCELHLGRQHTVFGAGHPQAELVIIGEAPSDDDDLSGQIFSAQAGQLLDAMLKAIGLDRSQVYLLNLLKCKLPGSRPPNTSELMCCDGYFQQQINLLQPKVIFAMGAAANHLLLSQQKLELMRRRAHFYNGIPVIVSLSVEHLLQQPADKRKAWQDLLQLKKTLQA